MERMKEGCVAYNQGLGVISRVVFDWSLKERDSLYEGKDSNYRDTGGRAVNTYWIDVTFADHILQGSA